MWRDSESDRDFLNFTETADQVAALVKNKDLLPISIGVFGTWGTGKSTVLKLIEQRLGTDNKEIRIVKFDAWLYQGFDDSRTALMDVVSSELLKAAKDDEGLLKKVKDFAKRIDYFRAIGLAADVGLGLALGIPPGIFTAAGRMLSSVSGGDVKKEDIDDLTGDTKETYKDLKELFKPGEKRSPPKEIDKFRSEFAALLTELNITLVLFVDNLDRCLPEAAIGTLEAIRLFLFMPGTAFVIAADEGMIRHSVAKYFADPQATHVRDYLDKVIQVPMKVPQVGVEDLRAYMYSLFISLAAPASLQAVQGRLLIALQQYWKGDTFTKEDIDTLAGKPNGLLEKLSIADRLAPILASAPNIQGNPRIVKRLLNAITLRQGLAISRKMNVDLAVLAKIAIFERCTDGPAALMLYRAVMDDESATALLGPASEGSKSVELPAEWKAFEDFITQWRTMEPHFTKATDLRAAVFLSRDVMAPARPTAGLSSSATAAVDALMLLKNINSPVSVRLIETLSGGDRKQVMSALIANMRGADWAEAVDGIHGAMLLAAKAPETSAELKAYVGSLQQDNMFKTNAYLVKQILKP